MVHWTDEAWADAMLALWAERPVEPAIPLPGTLWASRSSGRRGEVVAASREAVVLSFDEGNPWAQKPYPLEQFLRLYAPA
jgi:hypothetical protein